jgi:hypothetical protein
MERWKNKIGMDRSNERAKKWIATRTNMQEQLGATAPACLAQSSIEKLTTTI